MCATYCGSDDDPLIRRLIYLKNFCCMLSLFSLKVHKIKKKVVICLESDIFVLRLLFFVVISRVIFVRELHGVSVDGKRYVS